MHNMRWGFVTAAVIVTLFSAQPVLARQPAQIPTAQASLSPYWPEAVQQWEDLIVQYAVERGLDPDLVAALIWKESRGRADARSPAGAVGLTMVMPYEAGFTWRPRAAALLDPETNVAWGTRTLATVIRQSQGDVHSALAAYNGGWERVHNAVPQNYTAEVLSEYASAVAARCGLPLSGHWVATIALVDVQARSVLTVLGPQRPLTRYSVSNVAARIPDVVVTGAPTALVFSPPDGRGLSSQVGIWIHLDGRVVYYYGEGGSPATGRSPAPTPAPPEAWMSQRAPRLRCA